REAALDLLGEQAVARSRDLRVRPAARVALHALSPIQLDRSASGRHRLAQGRLLAGADPVSAQHPVWGTHQAGGWWTPAAVLHAHSRWHRLPDGHPGES